MKKNILKLHSLSSSPTSWYIEQINLLSLMHVMYETIFLFCLVVVVILIKFLHIRLIVKCEKEINN